VRKKAAEALVKLPSTPEIRDAFVAALKSDTNPAIRILAVEGLGKAATSLKDPGTIETLREKASDQKENGYIRGQAAQALTKVNL
jgi:HEAT repeat protein